MKSLRCRLLGGALSFSALFAGSALHAQDPTDPIADLQRRIEQLERDNQQLRQQFAPIPPKREFITPQKTDQVGLFDSGTVPPGTQESDWVSGLVATEVQEQTKDQSTQIVIQGDKISSLEKALKDMKDAAAKKTYPTAKVTGFFQADSVWVSQDRQNHLAIVNGAPIGDIQDGADFRRARLAATGDAFENVGYMVEMDFAFPGRPTFMDVNMEIRNIGALGSIKVGQWRQPFGMDALTGVKELMFLERNLLQAFVPFRQLGVGFANADEEYGLTWAGSVFRYPADFFGGNVGDDGGYGFSGRFTGLLLEGPDNETIHVGFDYCFADPSNNLLQFRNQPELFDVSVPGAPFPVPPAGTLPFFADTGLIPTQNFSLYGFELAGSSGPWTAQSELMITNIDQIGPGANLIFWGAYAQVGYVLTGEVHPYNKKTGVYTRVTPDHPFNWSAAGWGAWELAARVSYLDLTDKTVHGNELQDYTMGLNWYLNKNTKFQFNYVHAMLNSVGNLNSNADMFAVRAQVDF